MLLQGPVLDDDDWSILYGKGSTDVCRAMYMFAKQSCTQTIEDMLLPRDKDLGRRPIVIEEILRRVKVVTAALKGEIQDRCIETNIHGLR